MAEILSQSEIDELLNALNSGELDATEIQEEVEERRVRVYDFRRPHKFAKDHLRTMQVIYENYSRLIASYLSGILRTFCQVEVISVEPQTYYEFINSLPDPVILGIMDFRPLKGSAILEISPDISFAIIDKILGGAGRTIGNKRDFTEIELTLLGRILKQLIDLMDEPWVNVLETDFRLDRIETNPQFAQIISPNETIAIITMNISIGDIEGMINICIPHMVIEPIIDQLSTKYWFAASSEEGRSSDHSMHLAKRIGDTHVEMNAVLGMTRITVGEFVNLQVGDVIRLENPVRDEVSVIVGGRDKFSGIIGTKNNRYAVKITKRKGVGVEDE